MAEGDRVEIRIEAPGAAQVAQALAGVGEEVRSMSEAASDAAGTQSVGGLDKALVQTARSGEKTNVSLRSLSAILGLLNPRAAFLVGLLGRARILTLGVQGAIAAVAMTLGQVVRLLSSPVFLSIAATVLAVRSAWSAVAEQQRRATEGIERYANKVKQTTDFLKDKDKAQRDAGREAEIDLAGDPRVRSLMERAKGAEVTGPEVLRSIEAQISDVAEKAALPREAARESVLDQLSVNLPQADPRIAAVMNSAEFKSIITALNPQNKAAEINIAQMLLRNNRDSVGTGVTRLRETAMADRVREENAEAAAGALRMQQERRAPDRANQIELEITEAETRAEMGRRAKESAFGIGALWRGEHYVQRPDLRYDIHAGEAAEAEIKRLRDELEALRRQTQSLNINNSNVLFREPIYGPNAARSAPVP